MRRARRYRRGGGRARAVRIGVCVCVTATSVTATRDHRVCIFFDNEGAIKRKHEKPAATPQRKRGRTLDSAQLVVHGEALLPPPLLHRRCRGRRLPRLPRLGRGLLQEHPRGRAELGGECSRLGEGGSAEVSCAVSIERPPTLGWLTSLRAASRSRRSRALASCLARSVLASSAVSAGLGGGGGISRCA